MRNIQYSNMSTWRGCGWTYYFSLLDRGGSNLFDAERRTTTRRRAGPSKSTLPNEKGKVREIETERAKG